MLRARYGAKGKEILNVAQMYDYYIAWHNTNYLETADDGAKEEAALASALAGVCAPASHQCLLLSSALGLKSRWCTLPLFCILTLLLHRMPARSQ